MKEICKRVGIVFQYPEQQLFEENGLQRRVFRAAQSRFSEEQIAFNVKESLELVGLDYEASKTCRR
jgi:energy-coupling factor transport system ATP-binding protein